MVASMAEVPKTTYRLSSASVRPLCLALPFSILSNPDLCSLKGSRREGGREGGPLSFCLSPSMSNAGRENPHGLGKDAWGDGNTLFSFSVSGIVFIFSAFGSFVPNSPCSSVDPVPPSIRPSIDDTDCHRIGREFHSSRAASMPHR